MDIAGLIVLAILLLAIAYASSILINFRMKNGPFTTITGIQKVSSSDLAILNGLITSGAPGATTQPKPSTSATGYKKAQEVEPITNQTTYIQAHAEAVRAPAVATDLAAAGAALSPLGFVTCNARVASLFSIQTSELLGVIVVADSVPIFF